MYLISLDVITRTDLAAHLRVPVFDVPLQSSRCDSRRAIDWYKTQILRKQSARLQIVDDGVSTPQNY